MRPSEYAVSVMIPTYNRKSVLEESLRTLELESSAAPFNVIVVSDGSTDGTADMIRSRQWAMPVRVVEQQNAGSASARNRGAAEAIAQILLFIDDDMRAGPGLIDAHLAAHTKADAVIGRMVHDVSSPKTILASYVEEWLDGRHEEICSFGDSIPGTEVLTGHVSVKRALFEELGGFTESFNEGGRYGNEDLDFGERLVSSGAVVRYESAAVSSQYFCVDAATKFRQARDLGSTDVLLERSAFGASCVVGQRRTEWTRIGNPIVDRLSAAWPTGTLRLSMPHRRLTEALIDRGSSRSITHRWFGLHQALAYRAGVAEADELHRS